MTYVQNSFFLSPKLVVTHYIRGGTVYDDYGGLDGPSGSVRNKHAQPKGTSVRRSQCDLGRLPPHRQTLLLTRGRGLLRKFKRHQVLATGATAGGELPLRGRPGKVSPPVRTPSTLNFFRRWHQSRLQRRASCSVSRRRLFPFLVK